MSELNPAQKQSIRHTGTPLLVLAGAGSGKTRVITERIAWLSNQQQVDLATIAALTFTNKAAREMKQRVGELLHQQSHRRKLTVSTFHALGMRMLRHSPKSAGLRRGFSIIDPLDASNIIAELIKVDHGIDNNLASLVQQKISSWKNLAIRPEQVVLDDDPISKLSIDVYPRYDRYLRACNAVDLDDLILLPTRLLEEDADFQNHWHKKIRFLLVDEYQDTNGAQYNLLRLLCPDGKRLTVVGDDDQSIYAWRGARPQNLIQLNEDYPALTVIKLEQNYRSSARILKLANHLIAHNPRPFQKKLFSNLGYGDQINLITANNEHDEAERVITSVLNLQFHKRAANRDIAILYRSNHQARLFETHLRKMRIPYRLSGGVSFFDRSEIRDIIAYLRLLTNPADDNALLRIINTPRRGIGVAALERLSQVASKQEIPLFEALFEPLLSDHLKPRQSDSLRSFGQWMVEMADYAENGDPLSAVESLLKQIDYRQWLEGKEELAAADRRWENVESLIEWLARLAKDEPEAGLSTLVSRITLRDILDRNRDDDDSDEVNLMTLHAAKGLEFKHVHIVGLEEDILPHRVSTAEGAIEEERRLFYVGITRAMQTLTLSYAQQRTRYGELTDCQPSRFLQELPEDELEWQQQETDPEERVKSDKARFAQLRQIRANSQQT